MIHVKRFNEVDTTQKNGEVLGEGFECGGDPELERLSRMPNDKLATYICRNVDVETVLDTVETFIDEERLRDFYLACCGCDIV